MPSLRNNKQKKLEKIAGTVRRDIIKMLAAAGSGHPASSLGLADIFTAFYFHLLRHRPKNPNWPARDRLILSNGHACPARYAAMARAEYFPSAKLATLRQLGSPLQGHPELMALPGVETTSGSLGQGSSQAAGMAYAAKMDKARWRVFCVLSDAELQEGQTWEAFMFAAKYKLDNCVFIIDRNYIQIEGRTEEVMPLEPLADKLRAFNFRVEECDGNNIAKFVTVIERVRKKVGQPTVIIARTVPGKGVAFMEHKAEWHGRPLNKKEIEIALKKLS